MLTKSFDGLPDDSRVWVFGTEHDLTKQQNEELLKQVDNYLTTWTAHGHPLNAGRDWREERFLTIAVDQRTAGASGCSIDGLFRVFKGLERELGGAMITSGRVFYRDAQGNIQCVSREEFSIRAARGEITRDTQVFDLSVTTLGEWRARFESRAANSWQAGLLPERAEVQ